MSQETKESNQKKNYLLIILILFLITIIALGVTIVMLLLGGKKQSLLPPDYAPVETEENMDSVDGDETKLPQSEGGGAVGLTFSYEVNIDLSNGQATFYVKNPMKSNQDMVVQLVIKDVLVFQTGRLTPGHELSKMDLSDDVLNRLAAGGYEGALRFYYYDPDTGEKAMVNTNIPVNVTVVE